jgi:flagellar hook assembly protein FlgD
MNRVGTTNEYTYTFNSSSLTTDSTYGLRVYATSANGITNEKFLTVRKVGEELDPETETTITSISPISGPVGTTVFINGTNFNELKGEAESSAPDQVIVSFGSNIEDATQAVVSTSVSDTQIIATVPSSALTGRIYIKKPWAPVNTYIASTTNFTVERETDPSAVAPVVTIDHPEAGVPVNGNRATTYIDATTDIASVCYYDQTDFVFSDTGETGQELIRTGGTNLIHGRTINIEDNRSYTLYVKCAPKSNYDAGTVTADLIGSANITFSVTEATTCGYLELNRTKRVRVLNSIYGGMPITPGVTSLYTDFANRINELNPDIDAADIPEPFSSSNAETVINDWVDFINNADTSECNYEDVKTFNTNPVPEVDIEEPDEDETTGTNITLEVETDIASECKASFQDLEYSDDDDDNLEMEATNDDDDEFELEIEDIEEGETTIYVKCASKEDPTQIGEEEVTFTVEEVAPDGDLECTIDGDEDEFDPSLENIRFTYSVTGNSDVDEVDYTLSIENESGVEVLLLKTDRNEELDLEDLTKDWDGLVDGDRLVDGNYKAILRAEDKDDDRVTCTDEYEFELDDSLVDGIVLELEALDTIFEPTTSHVDIRLVNRVDGDRVVVNAYQLENAAPIRTIFYQCDNGEKCPQNKGELSKGYHDLKWDGSDSSGRFVAPGEYFFKVSLKDDDDNVFVAFSEAVEAQGYVGGGTPYPGAPTPPLFGTACSFTDVSPTDPDYQAVQWVCANGIFTGSNGTMNINQPLLRVDFIAVANRLAACSQTTYDPQFDGNLGFSDLTPVINDPSANWYLREIKNASRDCVSRGQTINGYPDGTIRIANQLVASEMWKVIIEAAKNGNKANYTFVADTSKNPWFTDYQTLLQTNGVPLTPADQGMTRRDAIRLLHNMYLRGLIR